MGPPEPIPTFDLYGELGVSASASAAAIDAAWRALVKRHHPDAVGSDADPAVAARRIRRLNVAHDWLSDPERRARYDNQRALRPSHARPRSARPASSTVPAAGAEQRAPPPEWRSPPPGWTRGEVRWTRRQPPPPVPSQPLRLSGAALGALGLILGVVVIGGALTAFGLLGDAPASDDADADDLAATIPGQVDGLILVGESGSGLELFGTDAGVSQLVSRAGGDPDDVRVAYKSAVTPAGGEMALAVIALSVESVSGDTLVDEFRTMTADDPNSPIAWTDASVDGRTVGVSRDPDDLRTAAYLLSSDDAMYMVISTDASLAETTIRQLPD